jgi:hypothetical protein
MTPPNVPQFGKFGGKAGLILAGIGLATVAFGWNGAAGQTSMLAQFPYLISGGLIGLSLVVLGAAMLVVQGAREDRAILEAKLDLLAEAVLEGAGRRTEASTPRDVSGLVVAGSASYHVPGCRLVDGREETNYLTPAEAQERELKPCRVCSPETATEVVVR